MKAQARQMELEFERKLEEERVALEKKTQDALKQKQEEATTQVAAFGGGGREKKKKLRRIVSDE
jgi:hypothetical protein